MLGILVAPSGHSRRFPLTAGRPSSAPALRRGTRPALAQAEPAGDPGGFRGKTSAWPHRIKLKSRNLTHAFDNNEEPTPMAEKEVSEALFNLRNEIERLDEDNPELKSKLEGLLDDLEDNLEATEDVNQLHLVEDMKEAVSQFEVQHPTLTGIFNELMVALGNMGI
jgi:hypothetical protein